MFKRVRWKLLSAFAAILILVATYLWIGKTPTRREYVDKVDPTTGYRCRFTMASDWTVVPKKPNAIKADEIHASFALAPPNPVKQWLERYLFHQPVEQPAPIELVFADAKHIHAYIPMTITVSDGYPVPTVYLSQRIVQTRHLLIDGCPGTIITVENMPGLPPYRGTELYVFGPHASLLWEVFSLPGDNSKTERELNAIIASFHIEKALPMSGKR